jgi:hypothetical protein
MSSPALKQSPAPDSTTARTDGSAARSRAVSRSPSNISPSMAFFFSGRFI